MSDSGGAHIVLPALEALEQRKLLAWGTYPQLIDQDLAAARYPDVTGRGTAVAIVDTGVDSNHPVLEGKLWVNPGETANNGIDDDRNGYIDDVHGYDFYRNDPRPEDENGHGTQMSGIIAGRTWTFEGAEYAGLAPETKLIHLKVADPTGRIGDINFARRIERALQWIEVNHARHNIVAVNLSLKVDQADFEATFADEAARLHDAGVTLVASGGHLGGFEGLIHPAMDPHVFSAGIVTEKDQMSPITQRGPELDLLAPGKRVPVINPGNRYGVSGEATSYPAPFITAAVALIKQVNPKFTPQQVIAILKESGGAVVDPKGGRVHRRLDMDDAIRLAIERSSQPEPEPTPEPPKPDNKLPIEPQRRFRRSPFNATRRIEFENFDRGGPGVSYKDERRKAHDNPYRTSAVSLARCGDVRGGWHVTATREGEWLEYTLTVPRGGWYVFEARVATRSSGARLRLEIDGKRLGKPMALPTTGAKQRWRTVSKEGLRLRKGTHVLRVVIHSAKDGAGPNLNWFRLVEMAS